MYADSSAVAKLVVEERESEALAAHLSGKSRRVVTSRLATVEVARAVRIANDSIEAQARTREIFDGVLLVDVGATILTVAAALATKRIRSLDAIHLATIELVDPDEVLVYDHRLRDSVRETGYVAASPGDD